MNMNEQNISDDSVRTYELAVLFVPTYTSEEAQSAYDALDSTLGSVQEKTELEKIDLAYPMVKVIQNKKNTFESAYFGSAVFSTSATELTTIKKTLDASDDVVRYMIISRTEGSFSQEKALQEMEEKHREYKKSLADGADEEAIEDAIDELVEEVK